jgi:hypothetical protein
MNIYHLDPSVDRRIKIVRQLEQVFDPYRMILKELKEKSSFYHVCLQRKTTKKLIGGGGGGAVNFSRIFVSRGGGGVFFP